MKEIEMFNIFEEYTRKGSAEARPVTKDEIDKIIDNNISISEVDYFNGSPLPGDMIARNPKNHKDQWLIAKKYFEDNFERVRKTCVY